MKTKTRKLHMRRNRAGLLFVLPWTVGLVLFFAQPLLSFLIYSFCDFVLTDSGYELLKNEGGPWTWYRQALSGDPYFPQRVFESLRDLLYQAPVIVFFALFAALLLSRNFRGRTVFRTVFFLPIIVTSGVLAEMLRSDMSAVVLLPTAGSSNLFDVSLLTEMLLNAGLPQKLVEPLTGLVANVADLVWKSGVQILIFLAALLTVPQSYYEVAQTEGATGWETFWKVTFPIVSPFTLANLIYTVVDGFTDSTNPVMRYVTQYFIGDMKFSYASAMSWIYFALILTVLAAVFAIFRRFVFYGNR